MAINFTVSYTFSPSTTISSSQVNQNFSDEGNTWTGIEAKTLTFSNLGVDTELKSGGTVSAANGTVAAPAICFTNSTGTGIYRVSADDLGIATAGVIGLEISNAQLITAYNNIVFSPTTKGIKGTTTNDSTAALNVGEYVASSLPGASNFGATATFADYVSMSLTAGDWDVSFVATANLNGATATSWIIGISTTAGNSSSGLTDRNSVNSIFNNAGGSNLTGQSVPVVRMSLAATTTVYAKYYAVHTAGGPPTLAGGMTARRVR